MVGAPFISRGVRGIVRSEGQLDYAVAARSLGAGHLRLLGRHLLPATRGFIAVELCARDAEAKNKIVHSNRWNIFQKICVPLLRGFDARMSKKVPHFEYVSCRIVNQAASVTSKLIACFGSIFDPLPDPSGMAAVDSILAICRGHARNDVIVRRKMPKPH